MFRLAAEKSIEFGILLVIHDSLLVTFVDRMRISFPKS
jgi:hypothetical protein